MSSFTINQNQCLIRAQSTQSAKINMIGTIGTTLLIVVEEVHYNLVPK